MGQKARQFARRTATRKKEEKTFSAGAGGSTSLDRLRHGRKKKKTEQKAPSFNLFRPFPRPSTNSRPKMHAKTIARQLELGDRAAKGGRSGLPENGARSISSLSLSFFSGALSKERARESKQAEGKKAAAASPPLPGSNGAAFSVHPARDDASMPAYLSDSQSPSARSTRSLPRRGKDRR